MRSLTTILGCCFAAVTLLVSNPSYAREVRIGNGGDSLAAEFVDTADEMLQVLGESLQSGNLRLPSEINFDLLKRKVETAKVFSAEKTFLESGVEVDALNYPASNEIIFSRTRMQRLVFNLKAQRTLVMHEYLWLAGVDDSSYKHSLFLVRKVMNGGDRGELWLLKDLALPGFQNPFRTPSLEFATALFVADGKRTRIFQNGEQVLAGTLDSGMPYCSLTLNPFQNAKDGTSVKTIRVGVVGTEIGSGIDEVALKMQRPTVIPDLRCFSGSSGRRPTLANMLDSLGAHVTFAHEGVASLGGMCRQQ